MIRLLTALGILMLGGGLAMAEVVLVDRGKSEYRIVVPSDNFPSERYAGEELQKYLEKMTGVRLPLVTDEAPPTSHEIWIGAGNKRLGKNFSAFEPTFSLPENDGYVLRTHGKHLVIVGARPRGTLSGVYAFLEEKLGVRWLTPEVEVVPQYDRIELPPLKESYRPPLEYREVFWTDIMRNPDFAARHRQNGQNFGLQAHHGGPRVVFFPFVHSFELLIPPDLYKDHPEYFPMIGGKRVSGYVQRCLSNPDVVKLAIERVRQWIKERPDATLIDVSQNDTGNWCQCPDCKALDDAEESPAASVIKFVNTIAQAIEDEYPHIRIETLAYQYTRKPPKTLRPRKNVVIRLCSIECCFAHPLADCPSEENRRFRDDIVAWQPVAPVLYVWDYTTNFAHYIRPFPNFEVLQSNVQFFVNHGVTGLFEQGNYSPGGYGEMGPLRAYVLAKLLWNPYTDVERHINDFLFGYYGKAGGPIKAYMELLHRQVREKGYHAHIFDPPTVPYLNDEVIDGGERLFDEAERIAESEDIRFRVQITRLPIWYVKLATNRVTGDERVDLLKRFLSIARKAGITHISEGMDINTWAQRMGVP
ncbi:MAG: DUF4838 domain-containing protein [Armatimonadota bacterium]|nr:DUF4838 domain-containing protein [Armatimonadota bacterium]